MTAAARAVLDTNVLVSALLNPYGPTGRLVDTLLGQQFSIRITQSLDGRRV